MPERAKSGSHSGRRGRTVRNRRRLRRQEMGDFYRRFFVPLVRRLVWRHGLSEEDARDVVQDAFLLGFVKLESFANPKAWFNQVVDHLAMNWRRKAKRHADLLARFGPLREDPMQEELEIDTESIH